MVKPVKKKKKIVGHVVVHCTGKDKGKRIRATPKPVSKEKAQQIHRAIQANKADRKMMASFKKKAREWK